MRDFILVEDCCSLVMLRRRGGWWRWGGATLSVSERLVTIWGSERMSCPIEVVSPLCSVFSNPLITSVSFLFSRVSRELWVAWLLSYWLFWKLFKCWVFWFIYIKKMFSKTSNFNMIHCALNYYYNIMSFLSFKEI